MSNWEFTDRIKEIDGDFVIEIPKQEYGTARGLKGQQRKVIVEL